MPILELPPPRDSPRPAEGDEEGPACELPMPEPLATALSPSKLYSARYDSKIFITVLPELGRAHCRLAFVLTSLELSPGCCFTTRFIMPFTTSIFTSRTFRASRVDTSLIKLVVSACHAASYLFSVRESSQPEKSRKPPGCITLGEPTISANVRTVWCNSALSVDGRGCRPLLIFPIGAFPESLPLEEPSLDIAMLWRSASCEAAALYTCLRTDLGKVELDSVIQIGRVKGGAAPSCRTEKRSWFSG